MVQKKGRIMQHLISKFPYWFLSKKPLFLDLYTSYVCLYVFPHFITCITEGNRYQRLRKETQNTEYWKPKTKFIVWNILMCVCDNLFLLYRWHLLEKSSVTNCSPNCAVINIFWQWIVNIQHFFLPTSNTFPQTTTVRLPEFAQLALS